MLAKGKGGECDTERITSIPDASGGGKGSVSGGGDTGREFQI